MAVSGNDSPELSARVTATVSTPMNLWLIQLRALPIVPRQGHWVPYPFVCRNRGL